MEEQFVVGLMSGTSVDGIDAALTKIRYSGNETQVDILSFIMLEYSRETRRKIFQAMDPERSNTPLICSLNFELGNDFAEAAKRVCQSAGFDIRKLDLIGTHGQTIFHIPEKKGTYTASTLQIAEPSVIAYQTGTTVISNFRVMDMAAGGQGAPLVPYVDYLLFHHKDHSIALQNIGGISNVTVIPESGSVGDVYAFDTGPGNMVIDELVRKFYGKNYDKDGVCAARGKVSQALLKEMMDDAFIRQTPPKTTGRENYGKGYVDLLLDKWQIAPDDLIATATFFTALSIAENYKSYILPCDQVTKMLISGGGSHNRTLVNWLRSLLPQISIEKMDEHGISSDAKEAVAFAVLANETWHGHPSNIPNATGASQRVVLGNITPIK
jgi:anhydro-N-acetylmuramic acid kinase